MSEPKGQRKPPNAVPVRYGPLGEHHGSECPLCRQPLIPPALAAKLAPLYPSPATPEDPNE